MTPLKNNGFRCLALLLLVAIATALPSCSGNVPVTSLKDISSPPLSVTILHVNDTHSYVTPHRMLLNINGRDTMVSTGGWSLLMAAVEDIRSKQDNVLLFHAGDMLNGTLWSTKFEGLADIDAMNTLEFNAFTPGEEDFSLGIQQAATLFSKSKFPVLAANMDVSGEASLNGKIKPYALVECGGQLIGVIGLASPDIATQYAGENIIFTPPLQAAQKSILELNSQGINKIIVLSQLGYTGDVELARSAAGIDVIIGGHSHTFMGSQDFEQVGLQPDMPYPMEVQGPGGDRVLIVQAWENNQLLGQLKLDFNEKGQITAHQGHPFLFAMNSFELDEPNFGWVHLCPCRSEFGELVDTITKNNCIMMYWDNADMSGALQPYVNQLYSEINTVVGTADENMLRGLNRGPGPLVADAFLWASRKADEKVQMALCPSSDIRSDIYHGSILADNVYMILPSGQNLAILTVKGDLLKDLLESEIDSLVQNGLQPPFIEIAGVRMTIDPSHKKGERISALQVKNAEDGYEDIKAKESYTLVTTNNMAYRFTSSQVNKMLWLGPLADRYADWFIDSIKLHSPGIKDAEALSDYIKVQVNIKNNSEERVAVTQASVK